MSEVKHNFTTGGFAVRARLEGIFHPQSGTPAFSAGVIWDPSPWDGLMLSRQSPQPHPHCPTQTSPGLCLQTITVRHRSFRRLQERPHFLPVSGFGATLCTQVPIFKATLFLSLTVLSPQPHSPPTTALERATLLKMPAAPVSHLSNLPAQGLNSNTATQTPLP